MKLFETKNAPQKVLTGIQCDCCKLTFEDTMETQEFLSWRNSCGYGNFAFGDLRIIEIDMCQYCQKALLGSFIRVVSTDYTNSLEIN